VLPQRDEERMQRRLREDGQAGRCCLN